MNLIGEVVSVSLNTTAKKQDGGEYPAWQIIFKDHEGRIKDITKHVNGLKFTKGLKESLESLQPGDNFTAVLEKRGSFNEVLQIVKEGDGVPVPNTPAVKSGKVTGSNYETPEEREWNRIRIIRQSAINYAINLLKTEKVTPEIEQVLSVATRFAEFVNQKD
jgi:hypothetical protein